MHEMVQRGGGGKKQAHQQGKHNAQKETLRINIHIYVYMCAYFGELIHVHTCIHIDKRQTGKLKLLPGSFNLWDW